MNSVLRFYLATVVLLLSLTSCRIGRSTPGIEESLSYHLRNAERYTREKEYEKAIQSYTMHMQERLDLKEKPEWENPYFYWLLIGDLYLKSENVKEALKAYELAENEKVSPGLISDRYRYVAHWYAERDKYDEAIEILTKYRDRDDLLFDLTRDRIARDMVSAEESAK